MNFDPTKAYITLKDGKVFQALDEFGEFDEAATALLIEQYLQAKK